MNFLKKFALFPFLATHLFAAEPPPTAKDVPYGNHERQVLDFYQAQSDKPTPLVVHIHGGGWTIGDKTKFDPIRNYLDQGISFVSINYRYTWQAQLAGIEPPVKAPLEDAARAIQFIRSKASEWNLDKNRIAATGGSAGACTSLWLALHDDMADLKSSDPVSRESTRLTCAAVHIAQTSLDPLQLRNWTPNSRYGGHAFGFTDISKPQDTVARDSRFQEFYDKREKILPWIKLYSPIELASKDDPPVYLNYPSPPALGEIQKDPTHTANYGVEFKQKLDSLGVVCELVYPGAPDIGHRTVETFLIDHLKR